MRKPIFALVLAALVGGLVTWLHAAGAMSSMDLRALDVLLAARAPVRPDPRIVVVELDSATLATLGVPEVLWRRPLARVLRALLDSGARAVLLDLMFPRSWSRLPPEGPVATVLEEADRELAEVLLSGRVVLIDYDRGRPVGPGSSEVLHYAAAAHGNVAYANLVTDRDGVVRRLPVYLTSEGTAAFVAGRLAELALDSPLRVEGQALEVGGRRLPLEQGSLRVNYPGPGGVTFPSVSFARLLRRVQAGQPLPEMDGKIVLIAPGALEFQDLVSTPLDRFRGQHAAGVEVHAAGLDTLLAGAALRRLEPAGWLILPMALLGGSLAAFGELRLACLGLAAASLALLAAGQVMVAAGLVPPVASALVALWGGWVADLAWRQATLERTRRQLTRVFGRFVSPQVMRSLLARPENLAMGGHRARITVLFCDINDFTPTCEGKPPEEVITMLNTFFREMLEVIFAHGGTVKQFVGDEILVLYGAPEPVESHAAQAVRTALAMVRRLEELKRRSTGPGFYGVKIGIHTGDVVVGNVGSEARSEYAAVGDTVNLAARIEGLAKKLGAVVLVSEVTRREAGDLPGLAWRSLGFQQFKGKTQEMEIWEVVSACED